MIPRGRIDIGWSDLCFAASTPVMRHDRMALRGRVESWMTPGGEALACLSVRSGFDLLLGVLALPAGSEVLMSAVNIRDMSRIVTAHNLVPVPVDLDMASLTLKREALERSLSPKARLLLVAHVFGSRADLAEVGRFCHQNGLMLIEDCAQAFDGPDYPGSPESDVAMFSFGPIKTHTCLGGALLCVKDARLLSRLRREHERWPLQPRAEYAARARRYVGIHGVLNKNTYGMFVGATKALGSDHDAVIGSALRGFGGQGFLGRIRRQPTDGVLATMGRRFDRFAPERLTARRERAESFLDQVDAGTEIMIPGRDAQYHSHWVVPICVTDPNVRMRELWTLGFDATRGATSIASIPPPETRPEADPLEARRAMEEMLFLPVQSGASTARLEQLGRVVSGWSAAKASVAATRDAAPSVLLHEQRLDVLVIGGGIMGAGVMRSLALAGLRVRLVERDDFASGTSSRSSNLIHGGLHYLMRLQLGLARSACGNRDALLAAGAGLVELLPFFIPSARIGRSPQWAVRAGLALYRRMSSLPVTSDSSSGHGISSEVPGLGPGFGYVDGVTDDAGLVLRVLREGREAGGRADNYVEVVGLVRGYDNRVIGARLRDVRSGARETVLARCVVNATGIWGDRIRGFAGSRPRLRYLRGSHLVIPRHRLPLTRAIAGIHPETHRPVYALPWNGVTLVGSTSIEHSAWPDQVPRMSSNEAHYLLGWLEDFFPEAGIGAADVQTSFSGVRAILDRGRDQGPDVSRDHGLLRDSGMLTIAGGKLTNFPSAAREVLRAVCGDIAVPQSLRLEPVLNALPAPWNGLPFVPDESRRILGRYGEEALNWIASQPPDHRIPLPGGRTSLAELRWAIREESVRTLMDLAMRRTRIGLTVQQGARTWLRSARLTLQDELGWDSARWNVEFDLYSRLLAAGQAWRTAAECDQRRMGTPRSAVPAYNQAWK